MRAVGLARNAGERARRHGAGLVAHVLVAAAVAGLGMGWLTADAGPAQQTVADAEPDAPPVGIAADGADDDAAPSPGDGAGTVAERARTAAALATTGDVGRLTVVVDGRERDAAGVGGTVADLLARLDVDVDDDDRVTPDRGHRLVDGDRVVIERVERLRREREVAIAADERTERTGALTRGQRRTVQEGRPGLVVITEELTRVGGETVDRTEIGRETVRAPRDTVIEMGTAPEPEPDPVAAQPTASSTQSSASSETAGHADPADPATWDRLAQCESGGNWEADTGNGYYGGLQFHPDTWRALGGTGMPHEHPRETQIEMGRRLHARDGWGAWPHCSRELGYR